MLAMWAVLAWLAAAPAAPAQEKQADEVARGQALFGLHCSACHSTEADHKLAPGLKGLFSKRRLQNGKKPAAGSIAAIIEQGRNGMFPFREMLRDAEKSHLLAYLKTL